MSAASYNRMRLAANPADVARAAFAVLLMPLLMTLVLAASAISAAADDPWRGIPEAGQVQVVRAINGNTLVLKGGRRLRLAGIQAPRLARNPGRKGWPLAVEAKAALAKLVVGTTIRLAREGRQVDRYGRLIAHAHVGAPPGVWVQGRLLTLGMARVRTYAGNAHFASRMLAAERGARAARRGIWSLDFYRVRFHRRLRGLLDTFQIVEGRVERVAHTRRWTYLNFGANWRWDFTISLDRRARRRFRKAGVRVASLEGKRVRVRGWIFRRNGPMIEATHPAQIEVLD